MLLRRPFRAAAYYALLMIAAFWLGLAHLSAPAQPVAGMEHMSGHSQNDSLHCQILCTTAIANDGTKVRKTVEDEAAEPLPRIYSIDIAVLALLFVATIRQLYRSSSWRPPDKLHLYCHYADGL
jgi:hypothetical protein